MAMVDLVS